MNNIKIGIRNNNSERSQIVYQIFEIVNKKIKNKKEYCCSIEIEDYGLLREKFEGIDKNKVLDLEVNQKKALTEYTKNIILFNDSFFDIKGIEQESIFLHEIGHIANKPADILINKEANPIILVYFEYLADKFLSEIDESIFQLGKVESDLKSISIDEIKNYIKISDNKAGAVKGQFPTLIRLNYYNKLYSHNEMIIKKIDLLIEIIRWYIKEIGNILKNIEIFVNDFNSKSELELSKLYNLSMDIHNEVLNLSLSEGN